MKKTLIIFGIILLALFLVLSILDGSDYAVEKKLWRVQKHVAALGDDPVSVPEKRFQSIISKYERILRQHPGTKLAPQIYFQIGRVYQFKKDYVRAIEAYQTVVSKYPENDVLCSQALLYVGQIKEVTGDENGALGLFRKIKDEYSLTDIGLNMPLYIANYYLRLSRNSEADQALKDAENYYLEIIKKNEGTKIEFDALRMLVTAYYAQDNWTAALKVLEDILIRFAYSRNMTPRRAALLIKSANTIAVSKLQKPEKAIMIFENFIKAHPEHQLNQTLEGVIAALKVSQPNVTEAVK